MHRIGRTARMAAVGRATSFATAADSQSVRAIETILGQSIPRPSSGQTDKKRLARNGSPEAPEAKRTRPAGNRRRPRKHTGQPGVRAEHRTEPAAILAAPVIDHP